MESKIPAPNSLYVCINKSYPCDETLDSLSQNSGFIWALTTRQEFYL